MSESLRQSHFKCLQLNEGHLGDPENDWYQMLIYHTTQAGQSHFVVIFSHFEILKSHTHWLSTSHCVVWTKDTSHVHQLVWGWVHTDKILISGWTVPKVGSSLWRRSFSFIKIRPEEPRVLQIIRWVSDSEWMWDVAVMHVLQPASPAPTSKPFQVTESP